MFLYSPCHVQRTPVQWSLFHHRHSLSCVFVPTSSYPQWSSCLQPAPWPSRAQHSLCYCHFLPSLTQELLVLRWFPIPPLQQHMSSKQNESKAESSAKLLVRVFLSAQVQNTKIYNKAGLLGQETGFSSFCFSICSEVERMEEDNLVVLLIGMLLLPLTTATQFPHIRLSLLRWKIKMAWFCKVLRTHFSHSFI